MDIFNKSTEIKTVYIYNISILNICCSFYFRKVGYRVIYHIHDPVPHKGWKKLPTYLLQLIQLRIATKVVVFSESLKDLTRQTYHTYKNIVVASHGYSSCMKSALTKAKLDFNFGWFGSYASYKYDISIESCLERFQGDNPTIFVGKGYPNNLTGVVYNQYLQDEEYYSLMSSVAYLVVVYKDVSFSGVIHDGVALNRSFVANELCKEYILSNYPHYGIEKVLGEFFFLYPRKTIVFNNLGWSEYVKQVLDE